MRLQNTNIYLPLLTISLSLTLTPTSATPSPATTHTITTHPPSASTAPEFTNATLFTSAILNTTNHYRTLHNATSLTYNTTLSRFASRYISSLPSCMLKHSNGPYGENLAIGCSDVTGCVELWGDEREEYDFRKGKGGFDKETGHFTQLVWRATTDVGCAGRWCGDGEGRWLLACEYWPRGNVVGAFEENVLGSGSGGGWKGQRVGRAIVVMVMGLWAAWFL